MDKCDLEPEQPFPRLLVDQLGAFGRKPSELDVNVVDFVGNVVHAGAAVGEEPADRSLLAERCKQLDSSGADKHGGSLDALVLDAGTVLELRSEESLVRVERVVQVVNGDAEVMDAAGSHG